MNEQNELNNANICDDTNESKKRSVREALLSNRWFKLAVASVCAFMLTFSLQSVGYMYAKYTSSAFGNSSVVAGVAKYSITVTELIKVGGETIEWSTDVKMKPGDKTTYSFIIENDSEVVVDYYIQATNTTGSITPLLMGDGEDEENLSSDDTVTVTKRLGIGATETLNFVIKWPEGMNSTEYCGRTDLIIFEVVAIQAD